MTIVAMVLSILLETGSLAYGYSQVGLTDPARWFVLLGIAWLLAHWRKYYWFSSAALFITLIAAAYGVWNGFTTIWMLLGALGGLEPHLSVEQAGLGGGAAGFCACFHAFVQGFEEFALLANGVI